MPARTTQAAQNGTEVKIGQRASLITTAETNQLKTSPGKVGHVVISNVGTTATLDIYDDADSNDAAKRVWEWVSADGTGVFPLQIPMGEGIRVVTGGTFGRAVIVWS
jgi:hypothetical protein